MDNVCLSLFGSPATEYRHPHEVSTRDIPPGKYELCHDTTLLIGDEALEAFRAGKIHCVAGCGACASELFRAGIGKLTGPTSERFKKWFHGERKSGVPWTEPQRRTPRANVPSPCPLPPPRKGRRSWDMDGG